MQLHMSLRRTDYVEMCWQVLSLIVIFFLITFRMCMRKMFYFKCTLIVISTCTFAFKEELLIEF